MHVRLTGLIEGNLNLKHDFAFIRGLHDSHVFRVVQPNGPRMLEAGYGGDGEVRGVNRVSITPNKKCDHRPVVGCQLLFISGLDPLHFVWLRHDTPLNGIYIDQPRSGTNGGELFT